LCLDALHKFDFDQDDDGELCPYALKLSPQAKARWVELYTAFGLEQAAAEDEQASFLAKLEGAAARLALLHHCVTHVELESSDLRPIGVKSIEASTALVRWFAYESRRVYATLAETDDQRRTRRLVEYIRGRRGRISVNDLQRSNSRMYPNAAIAENALDALVSIKLGTWIDRPQGDDGGRPTRDFVLLEKAHDDTDETPRNGTGPPTKPPLKPRKNQVSSASSVVCNDGKESMKEFEHARPP
jgi:hypothetical protein